MQGKITSLTSDVIEVKFTASAPEIGTVLKSKDGAVLTVESILDNKTVHAIVIVNGSDLKLGDAVTSTGKGIMAPVGKEALGRIFNVVGEPIDGKPLGKIKYEEAKTQKIARKEFIEKEKLIETGIKVIDFFIPMLEGDKLGMFGGAGVGKTLVIKEIISNLTNHTAKANNIFVGIGERSREGQELYKELQESKLIDKVSLLFAQMNETPGARMKIIYSALTMAEHFRDTLKENTFMFIDNIYRFTQAGSEISSSLGKIPSQSGYQPTLNTEVSSVQERISNNSNGSITSFQTVFVPADDITDPAVVAIFSHLDGSLVLDRKIASEGKYPAISPLKSSSNNLTELVVGKRHIDTVTKAKSYLQRYAELEDLLAVLGMDGLSKDDKTVVERARRLSNFFTQNFFTAEVFTKKQGDFVPLESTIESVDSIISGKLDSIPVEEFLYIRDTKALISKAKRLEKLDVEEVVLSSKERRKALKLQKKMIKNIPSKEIIEDAQQIILDAESSSDIVEVSKVENKDSKEEKSTEKKTAAKQPAQKKTATKKATAKKPVAKKKPAAKKAPVKK